MHNVATVIVGGGISGAAALHWLASDGEDVVLLEAGSQLGGVIGSRRNDAGALVESGPNSTLLSQPHLVQLIDDLDLRGEMIVADPHASKRFIVRRGALVEAPRSIGSFVNSKLFSASAKLRLLREPFMPRNSDQGEESVAAFVIRRFGREILDYAVNPFIAGVYAGRPEDLALRFAFPMLSQMEREHGSMLRGGIAKMRRSRREHAPPARRSLISFRDGMATLPRRIGDVWSAHVRTNTSVDRIEPVVGGWVVHAAGETYSTNRVIVATSAPVAARLVDTFDDATANALRRVSYSPIASVVSIYRRSSVHHALDGFGCLIPEVEQRRILGVIFSSSLFAGRAPEGMVCLTTFLGGARQPELVSLSDNELHAIVAEEHRALLETTADPVAIDVTRWGEAIPQYDLNHASLLTAIEYAERKHHGLYLAGNYHGGVSIGDCVHSSRTIADRVRSSVTNR